VRCRVIRSPRFDSRKPQLYAGDQYINVQLIVFRSGRFRCLSSQAEMPAISAFFQKVFLSANFIDEVRNSGP
jgi:hypothetical protein